MEENGKKTYLSVPLKIAVDIQLGPDGHPWIRMQFAAPNISTSLVFPHESAEDVIANITKGIRNATKSANRKAIEATVPDFTGIAPEKP